MESISKGIKLENVLTYFEDDYYDNIDSDSLEKNRDAGSTEDPELDYYDFKLATPIEGITCTDKNGKWVENRDHITVNFSNGVLTTRAIIMDGYIDYPYDERDYACAYYVYNIDTITTVQEFSLT